MSNNIRSGAVHLEGKVTLAINTASAVALGAVGYKAAEFAVLCHKGSAVTSSGFTSEPTYGAHYTKLRNNNLFKAFWEGENLTVKQVGTRLKISFGLLAITGFAAAGYCVINAIKAFSDSSTR